MPGDPIYQSTLPWDPTRPPALVVLCSDGRWRHHVEEFIDRHLQAGALADIVSVPGGIEPLTLSDLMPKDFNFLRRRLDLLFRAHGTRRLIAIGHEDCAWYKEVRLGPLKLDLRERQVRDLKHALALAAEIFPGIATEAYYARLERSSPPRVVFEAV